MAKTNNAWRNSYKDSLNPQEIWNLFEKTMLNFGFDNALVYAFSISDVQTTKMTDSKIESVGAINANGLSYLVGGNVDHSKVVGWALNGNMIDRDPLAKHVRDHGEVALLGLDFSSENDPDSRIEQDYFEKQMDAFGGRNALLVPLAQFNPRTPSGFGLHVTKDGAFLEKLMETSGSEILLECYRFAEQFDLAYRRRLAESFGVSLVQYTVLQALCAGYSNRAMAELLEIKEVTVSYHLKSLQRILEVSSVRELPSAAFRLGLIGLK